MIIFLFIWCVILNICVLHLYWKVVSLEDDMWRETKKNDGNFKYIYNGMSTLTHQIKDKLTR